MVRITAINEDGCGMCVEVQVEASYPDAVAEARAQATGLWHDVFADVEVEDE